MTIIVTTLAAMWSLLRELGLLLKEPKFRSLLVWMLVLLMVGMIFYHTVEQWTWLDSLYFSVITLSTVGYGDMSPTTPGSKVFTIVYIFIGLSIFISFVNTLAQGRQMLHDQRTQKLAARHTNTPADTPDKS